MTNEATSRTRAVPRLDHAREHPFAQGGSDVDCGQIGCTPQRLHDWANKAEVDSG
ncbi:hypothetical protein [Bradyrhizobium sp. RT9a]|uniref:hypothetical protein n=1 Tax=Bradyrhizobium sp. RT9a TaxID=3156384 RepID=UPI0033916F25